MVTRDTILQSGDAEKIWERFCGFFDLSVEGFMQVQEALLMEQLALLGTSPIGRHFLGGGVPRTVEEFRRTARLTRYEDYTPLIGECQEEGLPVKPEVWAHTSGRGGHFKWVPYTQQGLERYIDAIFAGFILAFCNGKGDVRIKEGTTFLMVLPPRPYLSGLTSVYAQERFNLRVIPPQAAAEQLSFQERIELGFKMALRSGVDGIGAISTVLFKMGEHISQRSEGMKFSMALLHPRVIWRLLRAWLRAKVQHRPMLPRDLWPAKGLICGGTDTSIYREQIEYYWGRAPFEPYACTEAGVMALQSWVKKGMVFYPYNVFLEFIPEKELLKKDGGEPATVLLNELQPGQIYEMVVTSLHGMPFVRYRPGDLIQVTMLEDEETGIKLPQMTFKARADGLIDLHSIVRLDEGTVWRALMATKTPYEEWSARKEFEGTAPVLRLYIETKDDSDPRKLEEAFHEALLGAVPLYQEAIGEMETNPIRVTPLAHGTFARYTARKQKEGVDLAHLKPSHMNAPDAVIEELLQSSQDHI